jgi:ATP-binding cassette subfamily C exporter for protease/lipase
MIVASILAARVLSPFIQLVGQWRILANAQDAYVRLNNLFSSLPQQEKGMPLPPPTGEITVENLSYALMDSGKTSRESFLKNIHFRLNPGEVLLMAGPSASGKSTLSRLVAGLLAPSSGKVRFNGVDAHQWDKEELGRHIGYLPQAVELLDGTIAENIARFDIPDEQKLKSTIELLNLQDFIESLPDGLDTQIGNEGSFLSGGRRQLIGLARAVYGNPRIVILDEPNANLDEAGDLALQKMVKTLKAQGTTFVIVSHLQGIKAIADYLMVLIHGQIFRYGKPDEVMASLQISQSIPDPRAVAA